MESLLMAHSPALPTVAELVASDYRKAKVFNQFGIDFCCGGKKTLDQVCREKEINLETLEQALTQVSAQSGSGIHWDFQSWDPLFLLDFIVQAHHGYVRTQLPRLMQFGEKVARVHGEHRPETREIYLKLGQLNEALLEHMDKEEQEVFPLIRQYWTRRDMRMMQELIQQLEHEHDDAGTLMFDMRRLSNNFTPPTEACNTYRVWYALLAEFEDDLHLHVHLENNIIFNVNHKQV